MGTSLIRNSHAPRTTIGPWAKAYCRVLGGGGVLMSEVPLHPVEANGSSGQPLAKRDNLLKD